MVGGGRRGRGGGGAPAAARRCTLRVCPVRRRRAPRAGGADPSRKEEQGGRCSCIAPAAAVVQEDGTPACHLWSILLSSNGRARARGAAVETFLGGRKRTAGAWAVPAQRSAGAAAAARAPWPRALQLRLPLSPRLQRSAPLPPGQLHPIFVIPTTTNMTLSRRKAITKTDQRRKRQRVSRSRPRRRPRRPLSTAILS